MVDEGKFREDLYYRLKSGLNRPASPPSKRGEDLPLLSKISIMKAAIRRKWSSPRNQFLPTRIEALIQYRWPGNIRELRNVIERMVVLSTGDRITLRDIPSEVAQRTARVLKPLKALTLEDNEKELIIQALSKHRGNRTRAAEQLGISRRTLHRKLNEYELQRPLRFLRKLHCREPFIHPYHAPHLTRQEPYGS